MAILPLFSNIFFILRMKKKSSFFLSLFKLTCLSWRLWQTGYQTWNHSVTSYLYLFFSMSWSVSHSRRSLISCQSPGLEINFHCCLHVLLQPFCEHTSWHLQSGWAAQKVKMCFFFSPTPPLHFFSLRWICSLIFFFYWSRIPFHVRTLLRDTIRDIQLKRLKRLRIVRNFM